MARCGAFCYRVCYHLPRSGVVEPVDGRLVCQGRAPAGTVSTLRTFVVEAIPIAPVTCPTTPALEKLFYPDARTIAAAARDLVAGTATGWLPEERSDLRTIEFKGPF